LLVLHKGSGRVLILCHFLMLPPFGKCFGYIRMGMWNGSAIIKNITNEHEVEYG
jgi:hypothetical protein